LMRRTEMSRCAIFGLVRRSKRRAAYRHLRR
jgi:hypothetical protein